VPVNQTSDTANKIFSCCAGADGMAPEPTLRLTKQVTGAYRHLDGPGEAVLGANQALRNDIT
jgi:hypothetical protein